MILRGIELCAVSYCAESSSAQYHIGRSQVLADFFDSAQYDTALSKSITVHFYTLHIRFVLHIESFDSDEIEPSIFFLLLNKHKV